MGSKRRSSDIISLLVSIYGSKDIFIDEYRAVLADRLLHQLNYNTARYSFDFRWNQMSVYGYFRMCATVYARQVFSSHQ